MPGTRGQGRGYGACRWARELGRGGICRDPFLERRVSLRCGTRASSASACSQRPRCWPAAARRVPASTPSLPPAPQPQNGTAAPAAAPVLPPADPGDAPGAYADLLDRIRAGYALTDVQHAAVDRELALYRSQPDLLDRTFRRGARYLHYIVERDRKARHADGARTAPGRRERLQSRRLFEKPGLGSLAVHAPHRSPLRSRPDLVARRAPRRHRIDPGRALVPAVPAPLLRR